MQIERHHSLTGWSSEAAPEKRRCIVHLVERQNLIASGVDSAASNMKVTATQSCCCWNLDLAVLSVVPAICGPHAGLDPVSHHQNHQKKGEGSDRLQSDQSPPPPLIVPDCPRYVSSCAACPTAAVHGRSFLLAHSPETTCPSLLASTR